MMSSSLQRDPLRKVSLNQPITTASSSSSSSSQLPPQEKKVRVTVRVRPRLPEEAESTCLTVKDPKSLDIVNPKNRSELLTYCFDSCYDAETTQQQLFAQEVAPLLGPCFRGENLTIFAYGNTGAGKTHTMQGGQSPDVQGIIPRTVKAIFARQQSEQHRHEEISVQMSFMEIYNEKVYDLLAPKDQDLQIREDQNRSIFVANLAQPSVNNMEEFTSLYETGVRNRSTAATSLNSNSSRSHSIVSLKVQTIVKSQQKTLTSKIHLIDLAGSEDNRKTENVGIRMTESGAINKSLFVLTNVVDALNQKSARIPYRDSKLTRILQDSLGGSSNSLIITNVAAGWSAHLNTYNALNFATKSRKVVNRPVVFEKVEETLLPKNQEKKLETWRARREKIKQQEEELNGARTAPSLPVVTSHLSKQGSSGIPLISASLKSRGIFKGTTQERLEALEERLQDKPPTKKPRPEESESILADVELLLTPSTKFKMAKAHIEMARKFEDEENLPSALGHLKEASKFDEDPRLKLKIQSLEEVQRVKETSPSPAPQKKKRKSREIDEDEFTPDENPSKKQKTKSPDSNLESLLAKVDPPIRKRAEESLIKILNEGSLKQIKALDGIGPKRAQKIVEARESRGSFEKVGDLDLAGLTKGIIANMLKGQLLAMDVKISEESGLSQISQ